MTEENRVTDQGNQPSIPEPSNSEALRPTTPPTTPVAPSPVAAAPEPLPTAKPKRSSGRLLNIVLGVAVAVAVGGVAFAIGRTTAPASAGTTGLGGFGANFPNASFVPGASGAPGFPGGGRGAFGGAGLTIRGTVESVDGDLVTIKTTNGQTIQVSTSADTTYSTQTPGSASDVTDGTTVQVQVDPTGGAGGFGGGLQPGASNAPTGPVGTAGSITVVP